MKFIKYQKGQIGIIQLLSIGSAIVVAVITGYFTQASRTDAKIEDFKTNQVASTLELSQRVTVTETKTENLQKDVSEIKGDVKEILKRIK